MASNELLNLARFWAKSAASFGSVRLGLKFFQELPWRDAFGVEITGALAPLDLWKVAAGDRLATLAALAIATLAPPATSPPAPLLLCAPVPAERFDPRALLDAVCKTMGPSVDAPGSRVFATGRLAFLDALGEAERLLSTRTAREVVLGGVDSLVDHDAFDALMRAGRIKTATNDGIIAGEGAAFLRLALAGGRSSPAGALACVASTSRATELRTRDAMEPNTGAGLAGAGRAALKAAGTSARDVGSVVHAAAGDRFGQREVGLALARLRLRTEPPPTIWAPASAVGDIGAAYGPFALALAAFFLAKKVDPPGAALVLASGDDAGRGAAVITAEGT